MLLRTVTQRASVAASCSLQCQAEGVVRHPSLLMMDACWGVKTVFCPAQHGSGFGHKQLFVFFIGQYAQEIEEGNRCRSAQIVLVSTRSHPVASSRYVEHTGWLLPHTWLRCSLPAEQVRAPPLHGGTLQQPLQLLPGGHPPQQKQPVREL